MEERIKILKSQVQNLLERKKKMTDIQIPEPVGPESRVILNENLPVFTGRTKSGPFGSTQFDIWLEVFIDGDLFWLAAQAL